MSLRRRFLVLSFSFDPSCAQPVTLSLPIVRAVYEDPAPAWTDIREVYKKEQPGTVYWVQEVLTPEEDLIRLEKPKTTSPVPPQTELKIVPATAGGPSTLALSDEQMRAFQTVQAVLREAKARDQGLLGIGSTLILNALHEYGTQFLRGF
jgi:hypothetical protein